ncbi:MAG: hypothetical protein E7218_08850 [Anaerofustis stercorihominis]|nr:hypothetical protein [Anaerofustis stercorihominis]
MCFFKIKKLTRQIERELESTGACATLNVVYLDGDIDIIPGTVCQLYAFDDRLEIHVLKGRSRTYSYSYEDLIDIQSVKMAHPDRYHGINILTYRLKFTNAYMEFEPNDDGYKMYNSVSRNVNNLHSFVEGKLNNRETH